MTTTDTSTFPSGVPFDAIILGSNGAWFPNVRGGSGEPPALVVPPAPAAPLAPPAPDLAGLQKLIDSSKAAGTTEATSTLLSTLGFDKIEDLQGFVTAKREADDAAKTEQQKAIEAAQTREAAAVAREREAQTTIDTSTVHLALARAGVTPDVVATVAPLVRVEGAMTAEAADAAIAIIKANPAFSSLFGAAPAPRAPAGHVPGGPPPAGAQTVVDAFAQGAAMAAKRHPKPLQSVPTTAA